MDSAMSPFDPGFLPERKPDPGHVVVLVLEHPPEIPMDRLSAMRPWSVEDRERMAFFRVESARTSWCLSRILARESLSRMLGVPAGELGFAAGPFGKPYLRESSIRFNWAHANGCVVFAATDGVELGCDVEHSGRSAFDGRILSRECFTAEEARWVESAGGESSDRRFLALFVQKEAWLKAGGWGLSRPMAEAPARFSLPPASDDRGSLIETPGGFYCAVRIHDEGRDVEGARGAPGAESGGGSFDFRFRRFDLS